MSPPTAPTAQAPEPKGLVVTPAAPEPGSNSPHGLFSTLFLLFHLTLIKKMSLLNLELNKQTYSSPTSPWEKNPQQNWPLAFGIVLNSFLSYFNFQAREVPAAVQVEETAKPTDITDRVKTLEKIVTPPEETKPGIPLQKL